MNLRDAAQHYQALRAALLEAMPDLAEDPDYLLDTLEGITDVHEQLAALLRSAVQDEALVYGLKDLQARMAQRKSHFESRAQRKRQIALHHMEDLDIKTITAADLTVTRRSVPPAVIIVDQDRIPKEYLRIKYEPNKFLIKQALNEGKLVDGCLLSNTSETISIKV